MTIRRRTAEQVTVLRHLLSRPGDEHYGQEIIRATGLKSGVLYPMLRRFEEDGLIETRWEEGPYAGRRPPRRLVKLTDAGRTLAVELAENAAS